MTDQPPDPDVSLPLGSLKVLDMARGLAGPFAATLLADFGADVIKVEEPPHGDFMRNWGPPNGIFWKSISRGKRSIAVNMKAPAARPVLQRLVEWADVLIESFRPGVMDRLDLSPDQLQQWNPGLVVLSVSGYGQTGPNRERPGFGKVAEAYAGLAHVTGMPDGPPIHAGFAVADMTTGLMGAFGILVAILGRLGDGQGQVIDLALYESILRVMDYPIPVCSSTGVDPMRVGNHQVFGAALSNVFATKDGRWITYSAGTHAVARRVLGLVGGDDLADDPRFGTLREMAEHEPEIDERLKAWMGERTAEEIALAFADAGAVAAVVQTASDLMSDPHIAARENLIELPGVDAKFVAPLPKLSRTPGRVRNLGPAQVGADSRRVLSDTLGLNDKQIEELVAAGALGSDTSAQLSEPGEILESTI